MRAFHLLSHFKVWMGLNITLSALLLWALTGGLWDPLPGLSRAMIKLFGFICLALMLGYFIRPELRHWCLDQINKLEALPETLFKKNFWQLLTAIFLALSFLVVYKHQLLQSHTFELGVFNNVTWNVAHGNGFKDTVLHLDSYLGDHWQPILILYAPLIRIWESGSVFLLAQSLFIVLGFWGIFELALLKIGNKPWALLCALLFLLHPDLHKIHRFDFHPEVMGFAILPWAYIFHEKKKWLGMVLLLLPTLFIKEDFPIVLMAFGAALFLMSPQKKWGLIFILTGMVSFVIVSSVLMPTFLGDSVPTHLSRYAHLGDTPLEMFRSIILKPHMALGSIIFNPLIWKTAFRVMGPFLFLPLLNGPWILATLVAWFPHAVGSYWPQQALQCQYAIPILVFLSLGAVHGLSLVIKNPDKFKNLGKFIIKMGPVPIALLLLVNYSFGVPRYFKPYPKTRIETFHKLKKLIPPGAAVCAQQDLGPHLSFRENFYLYPDFIKAEYIFLDVKGNQNPFKNDESYKGSLKALNNLPLFEKLADQDGFLIYKRIPSDLHPTLDELKFRSNFLVDLGIPIIPGSLYVEDIDIMPHSYAY